MNIHQLRRLAALTLAMACVAATAWVAPAGAGPTTSQSGRLDFAGAATEPLVEDLVDLLAAAQYVRNVQEPEASQNSIISVQRIGDALRTHRGVACVLLARRELGADRVALKALYVLEGDPIAAHGAEAPSANDSPGRGAIRLDLDDEAGRALLASLQDHLGPLVTPTGAPTGAIAREAPLGAVLDALASPGQLAYVVLAARTGGSTLTAGTVFVVPDVLRISIRDTAGGSAAGKSATMAQPEVKLVPHPDGGPPLIKFQFDPRQYEVTEQQR
ncbi:MAG: hypothetical protein LJE69_09695 [Thiohalocapsa sp.]|jgi:hypothetical protein|uniref:hypothetical protein n=1 Tax=Thiohalocapsa sp. TaxID=2497641 RepID=UPI0025EB3950|nr:hypothetical protein [Thiohalocapsa sp.]MCG6941510.1 hypothetical protein [Thiohalocapsa sp.]